MLDLFSKDPADQQDEVTKKPFQDSSNNVMSLASKEFIVGNGASKEIMPKPIRVPIEQVMKVRLTTLIGDKNIDSEAVVRNYIANGFE